MEYTTHRKDLLWYSLVATQLSVTGGILALVSGVTAYSYLVLLAPITAVLGIVLFAQFHSSLETLEKGTVDYDILAKKTPNSLPFPFFLIFSTAIVYLFVLGWELYIGATVIAKILGLSETTIIAVLLSIVVIGYTFFSGFTRAVITDRIQLFVILGFIFLLLWLNWDHWSYSRLSGSFDSLALEGDIFAIFTFALTLLIINISAQLQSPSNWIIAKSADLKTFRQIQYIAVPVLLLIWGGIILFALGLEPSVLQNWLNIFGNGESQLVTVLLFLGVLALIMSSVDTTMLGISGSINHAYCYLRDTRFSEFDPVIVRVLNVFVMILALGISFGLLGLKPELFYSLLSITGLLSIYAGYIFYFAIGKSDIVSNAKSLPLALFCIFVLMVALQVFGFLDPSTKFGFYVVVLGAVAGIVLPRKAVYDAFSSN